LDPQAVLAVRTQRRRQQQATVLAGPIPTDLAALQVRFAAGVAAALRVPVGRVEAVGAARVRVPFMLRGGHGEEGKADGATLRTSGRRAVQDAALGRVAVRYKLAAAGAVLAVPSAAPAARTRQLCHDYVL
jgi:hypothetical protein